MTLLIERGAELDITTREGCTALWMAAQSGAAKTVSVSIIFKFFVIIFHKFNLLLRPQMSS